jgi:hypothetical protein
VDAATLTFNYQTASAAPYICLQDPAEREVDWALGTAHVVVMRSGPVRSG